MKKTCAKAIAFDKPFLRKIILMSKLCLLLLTFTVFTLSASNTYSQQVKINLEMKNATLSDVINAIKKQTEFEFAYDSNLEKLILKNVSIKAKNEKIDNVLASVLQDTEINYRVIDKIILLSKNQVKTTSGLDTKMALQQLKITGKITDASNGSPLPGVNILVQGTTIGTVSDMDGNYSIEVPTQEAVLVFSFIGYVSENVKVGQNTTIDISLVSDVKDLQEVVVVGYGTRKKETLTGAISKVNGKDMKVNPSPNLSSSLGGKIPGIIAVNSSGQPGDDGTKLLIRGLGTLNNNSPLIIVDGIESASIDRIDPNDIESLSVLKDASAAIYGSKAANGVIIVTTKRGTKGKPKVEYGYNLGLGKPTVKPEIANAYEYNKYINAYYAANNEADKQMSEADLEKLRTGSDPDNYFANTDWWDAVVRNNAPIQRHTASIRGGTEELKYFASVGHLDQQSVFKNGADGFKQNNYRANFDWQLNKYIKIGINLDGRFDNVSRPTTAMRDIWWMTQAINPRFPVHFSNGLPWEGKEDGWNPIMMATNKGGTEVDKTNAYRNMATFEVKLPWVEGLSVDGWYSYDNAQINKRRQQYPWTVYGRKNADGINPPSIAKRLAQVSLTERSEWSNSQTFNTKLNYARKFGKHDISAFIAYEQNEYNEKWISSYRNDIITTNPDAQLFMGSRVGQVADGSAYKSSRQNYFTRVSYNYDSKYLVDFNFRRDGSPLFPSNKRFGNFPGVSASWRISEENFLKSSAPFINNLKLRASWGQLGNDRLSDKRSDEYQYLTAYNYVDAQVIMSGANNVSPAFYPGVNANPNITWEVAENKNIGIEAGLWDRLIEIEFDVYRNSRNNILITRSASIPDYVGLKLPKENLGEMRNQGFELLLTHNYNLGDFNYSISGNYSYNDNEVIDIDETPNVLDWQKRTGKPFTGQNFADGLYYQTNGLYSQADIENADLPKYGGAKAGDIKVIDYNKDGKINGDDRVRMDKSLDVPRIMYGFSIRANYKAFDLNMVFQGAEKVYRYLYTADIGIRGNFLKEYYTDYYSESNPNGRWPKANPNTFGSTNNNDFFILPAGYLRLSSMEIGYNLPKSLLSNIHIEGLRFYFSGSNLFLVYNKLKYFDPEAASDGNGIRGYSYPRQRILNFGVNVSF